MSEQKQRITVRYEGRVQGVCFRFTAVDLAQKFDVTGFVRNCCDGSVELVAEGVEEEVMGLVNAIRLSHLGRGILKDQVVRSKATGEFESFTISF